MKSEVKSASFAKTSSNREKEYVCVEKDRKNQRICTLKSYNLSESGERNIWLLDSGASTHACNNPSMFEVIESEHSKIIVGYDREIDVTGRGIVKLKVEGNGQTNVLTLEDVALVPELGANLFFTGRLEIAGLKITTENGMSKISLKNEMIGYAIRTTENPYLYEFKDLKMILSL